MKSGKLPDQISHHSLLLIFVFARASVLVPHSEAALPLCMLLIYCDSKEK